jgi:uncharacterized protein YqgV (UPF0045/DUF77 family)
MRRGVRTTPQIGSTMVKDNHKGRSECYIAFQVIPRARRGNNFELVDRAIEVVQQANVPYQVSAMETTMKGELEHLLNIVKAAQQRCIDCGAIEVITNIKIHLRTEEATDTFCTYERGLTPNNAVFLSDQPHAEEFSKST